MRARDNPFRTEQILKVRYRIPRGDWDALLARFDALGRRAAIVGPQGSGKTTLLEDLAPLFRGRGFTVHELRLDTDSPRFDPAFLAGLFETVGARDVLLFDGAEQLDRGEWLRFDRGTRSAGGLLVTSHQPGLLPTLLETSTSPELLSQLVEELLGEQAGKGRPLVPGLFEKHGGNLREALRELYDHYAGVEA